MQIQEQMKELIAGLNDAARRYYTLGEQSSMTDKEYDAKLKELSELEYATEIIFDDSPTQRVGYIDMDCKKVKHEIPLLSLNSTKELDDIDAFIRDQQGVLSWKIDGVSITLYYEMGLLKRALSRGNGIWGKDITKNVVLMMNVPLTIPNKNAIIVRGEGCISLKEFDLLKKTQEGEKYMNPRNLASGLINGTKTTSLLLKHMKFIAHSILKLDGELLDVKTRKERLLYLEKLGFKVVENYLVDAKHARNCIIDMSENANSYPYPVDGLVLALNDLLFSESLGATAKFPHDSIAFKWPDETKETCVIGMKWSVSNTGLITPIVQFKPILLEGTTVKQANLHSLKIFQELKIGIGDKILIYKANKIIPRVERNLTNSNTEKHPTDCPVCGNLTTVIITDKTEKLQCNNCRK